MVAIAATAHACGVMARSIESGRPIRGLGWLPAGVVEPNFDPAHDRRLRQLLALPEVTWGLGIPSGSAVLLGPEGQVETVGTVFALSDPEGDLGVLAAPE